MHVKFTCFVIRLLLGLFHDFLYYTSMDNSTDIILNVAVIGVGRFGSRHLEKWLQRDDINVIGFNDIDPDVQEKISRLHHIPYLEIDEILEQAHIVDIVVPSISHYSIALKALQAKKHIFVEKPFTITVDQARHLTFLAEKYDLTIGIGHIERFNPVYEAFEKKLDQIPDTMDAYRQGPFIPKVGLDVSVVMELMIHDIDMMLQLIPSPIDRIEAGGSIEISKYIDVARARITFQNGSIANLFASRNAIDRQRYTNFTSGEHIYVADFMNRRFIADGDVQEFPEYDAMQDELTSFTSAVLQARQHRVNGHDGIRSIRIAKAIEKAILATL